MGCLTECRFVGSEAAWERGWAAAHQEPSVQQCIEIINFANGGVTLRSSCAMTSGMSCRHRLQNWGNRVRLDRTRNN